MQFRDIIGQQSTKSHLVEMHREGRVPHAMLLLGPEGSGALALAVAFAQYINCTGERRDGDSCGECPQCRQYAKLSHPDLHFVYPIVKNSDGSGDSEMFASQWRSMFGQSIYFGLQQWLDSLGGKKQGIISKDDAVAIHRKLSLNSYEGGTQVMIIWRPELMNDTASNRLLKILEEPPSNTIFILVSESSQDILPTILSRTQVLKVPPICDDDMADRLMSADGLTEADAKRIAHIAQGSYVRARQLLDDTDEMKQNIDFFKQLMRTCYGGDMLAMMTISDAARDLSREAMKSRLNYSLSLIRQCFVMNLNEQSIVYMTPDEEQFAARFAPFVHLGNVMGITQSLSKAIAHIEQNGNDRIVMLDLMMQMAVFLKCKRPE